MSQLLFYSDSPIDNNLEKERGGQLGLAWQDFLLTLPHVIDVEWYWNIGISSYTRITFESEAHKDWFILRWS